MKKKKFDSMVAFTKPLYLPGDTEPVYGFAFALGKRNKSEIAHKINTYVQYLTCLCKWCADGGSIDDNNFDIFYDANGIAYRYNSDEYMIEYEQKAYEVSPIRYNVIYGNMKFGKKDLDDSFIIKEI